jgi:hypothetical protein
MTVPRPLRALQVEDNEDDALLLVERLKAAGFAPETERVDTADALRRALGASPWDIVFCDYSMPGFGALEALQILGASGLDLPCIIVSGTIGEEAAVEALTMGADDYLLKHRLARLGSAVDHCLAAAALRRGRRLADEENRRLAAAVTQAAEAIVIVDKANVVVYVNPAMERMSGYSRDELIGQSSARLWSDPDKGALYRSLAATVTAGQPWSGNILARHRTGTSYDVAMTVSPVYDVDGHITHYVTVSRDVTYERQVEEQLRQAQKLDAIGQVTGGVAHDFNNLLAIIRGNLDLLQIGDDVPLAWRDSLAEIAQAADRAASLTRQLLLFSRRQAPQFRVTDLNALVSNMGRMLGRVLGEAVQLEVRLAEAPLPVFVDQGMIDQVLLNLAVNARDAMPRGGQLIVQTSEMRVDAVPPAAEGAVAGVYSCLTVSDSGTGIDAAVLPHIFEPFFTTKEAGAGTGLGLSTVFGIARQHGGWVTVESEVGRGSTFRMCVPRSEATVDPVPAPLPVKAPGGTATVLVVEDDLGVRRMIRNVLSRAGYRVLEAGTGVEGVEVWTAHQGEIDLLLTDLVMPGGMSGIELGHVLQAHDPGLEVVYSSGYASPSIKIDVKLEEGENFLPKPYSPQALATIVARRVKRGRD